MKGKPLTPRQRQLLRAYAEHGSVKQAALALGCAEQTVKNGLYVARLKLGVDRTFQALMLLEGKGNDHLAEGHATAEGQRVGVLRQGEAPDAALRQ